MSARRHELSVLNGLALATLLLGGCAAHAPSPTDRALAGMRAEPSRIADASHGSRQRMVMAQDGFGAMANKPVTLSEPNGTTTAGIDETR